MTMTTIVIIGLVIVLIGLMISHWPQSLWEPRGEWNVTEGDDPVFWRSNGDVDGWFFTGYDGIEWGPFQSEAAARVNHRNYLLLVDDPQDAM
jgi:hypothetical protein